MCNGVLFAFEDEQVVYLLQTGLAKRQETHLNHRMRAKHFLTRAISLLPNPQLFIWHGGLKIAYL